LAVETNEENFPTPFDRYQGPSAIHVRTAQSAGPSGLTFRTERRTVRNRRALWIATTSPNFAGNATLIEMLLKLAVTVDDSQLLVKGIDGNGRVPGNSAGCRPDQLTYHWGQNIGGGAPGIVRDCLILERLLRLFREMSNLDREAHSFGTLIVLMGSAHVASQTPWEAFFRNTSESPASWVGYCDPPSPAGVTIQGGGYYPIGFELGRRNHEIASNYGNVTLERSSYFAIKCLMEGAALPENVFDVARYVGRPSLGGDWWMERDEMGAVTRMYDFLSSLYFSYNGGVDTSVLESFVPPPPAQNRQMLSLPNKLSRRFNGLLYFRRFSSWIPFGDPFYSSNIGTLSEMPPIYYVPDHTRMSLSEWESRWRQFESLLAAGNPSDDPGTFGVETRQTDTTQDPAGSGGMEQSFYGRSNYRRVTLVIPHGAGSGQQLMLIGYGFMARRGEVGELQVLVLYRGVRHATLQGNQISVLSDTMLLVTLPNLNLASGTWLDFEVRFPTTPDIGRTTTARIAGAVQFRV